MCWWKVCSIRYHGISPSIFPSQVASLAATVPSFFGSMSRFTPALQEPKPGSRNWGSLQPLQLRGQTHRKVP